MDHPTHLLPIDLDDPSLDTLVHDHRTAATPLADGHAKMWAGAVDFSKSIAQVIAAALLAYAAMAYQKSTAQGSEPPRPSSAYASPAPATTTEAENEQARKVAVLEQRVNDMRSDIRDIRTDVKTLLSRDSSKR